MEKQLKIEAFRNMNKCSPSEEIFYVEPVPKNEKPDVIEREIIINNMKIHIKSIFTAQTQLDEALKKIVTRKLSETKKTT